MKNNSAVMLLDSRETHFYQNPLGKEGLNNRDLIHIHFSRTNGKFFHVLEKNITLIIKDDPSRSWGHVHDPSRMIEGWKLPDSHLVMAVLKCCPIDPSGSCL